MTRRTVLMTLFPTTALLGFAGWVALIVETDGPWVAMVSVIALLTCVWRLHYCHYQIVNRRRGRTAKPAAQDCDSASEWWQ